jgi:hypothetical protein
MSTMSLSAAVLALQPRIETGVEISSETTLKAWTVIEDFSDQLSRFTSITGLTVALAVSCIGVSLLATLIRTHIPTIPTQNRQTPANSEFSRRDIGFAILHSMGMLYTVLVAGAALRQTITNVFYVQESLIPGIAELRSGMATSFVRDVSNWNMIQKLTEECPRVIMARAPSRFLIQTIFLGIMCAATYANIRKRVGNDEEKFFSEKKVFDYTAVASLGLASLVYFCGYIYTKNFVSSSSLTP